MPYTVSISVRIDLRLPSPTFVGQGGVELRIGASFKTSLGFRFASSHFSRLRASHGSPVVVASDVFASYRALWRRARVPAHGTVVLHKNFQLCTSAHMNPRNPQRLGGALNATKPFGFPDGFVCARIDMRGSLPSHRRPRWRRTSQASLPRASRRSPVFVSSDVLAA